MFRRRNSSKCTKAKLKSNVFITNGKWYDNQECALTNKVYTKYLIRFM